MADHEDQSQNENVLDLKRLFVGGLPNDVSTKDLRMKFTPFGIVKDIEIINRKDDTGLTTYNNCTWKGGILKVQIAKEHFLSRLEKEKNITKEEKRKSNVVLESSVPGDIKSAVPGTPIPDKRNWVIGKFGRALPVVFLRRKDGRKIVKFDPSKTVHCLKRIRVDEEDQSQTVDSLTWDIRSGKLRNGKSNSDVSQEHDKRRKHLINETQNNDNTELPAYLANTKKKYIKCTSSAENKSQLNGGDIDATDNVPTSSLPGSEDNTRRLLSNDELHILVDPKKALQKRNDTLIPEVDMEYVENDSYDFRSGAENKESISVDTDTSQSDKENVQSELDKGIDKNQSDCTTSLSDDDLLSRSSDIHSVPLRNLEVNDDECLTKKKEINNNFGSTKKQIILAHSLYVSGRDNESPSKADIASSPGSDDSSSSSVTDDSLSDEEVGSVDGDLPDCTNPGVAVHSVVVSTKNGTKKKEMSNKLRLETLKERTEVIQKQKDIVKNALQNIDSGRLNVNNHLLLDQDNDQMKKAERKKITGAKALSWLGMDSSSDEDEKDEGFHLKEHLHGKSGEKLMKLQQKIGYDQRFNMDERFLEDDEELVLFDQPKQSSSLNDSEGDEINQQLKTEKQLSLNVLHNILGNNAAFTNENEDSRNQYRDSMATHYDPSREDHEKFEERLKRSASPDLDSKNSLSSNKTSETAGPVITKSKFYSVSGSLKQLFEKKNDECETFSFFSDFCGNESVDQSTISVAPSDQKTNWKAPFEVTQPLPYDSSASESEDDVNDSPNIIKEGNPEQKRHLFYHLDDQEMIKVLNDESSSFMRKDSVETIEKYWVDVRQKLTQDYKKKRKDALRRQKKLAHRK